MASNAFFQSPPTFNLRIYCYDDNNYYYLFQLVTIYIYNSVNGKIVNTPILRRLIIFKKIYLSANYIICLFSITKPKYFLMDFKLSRY